MSDDRQMTSLSKHNSRTLDSDISAFQFKAQQQVEQELTNKCEHNQKEIDDLKKSLNELKDILKNNNIEVPEKLNEIKKSRERAKISKYYEKGLDDTSYEKFKEYLDLTSQYHRKFRTYISYRDLSIWTMMPKADIPTVGGALVKCLCGSGALNRVDILKGLSGRILPGKLTLLLGPPGSGKSTFLKALSDRLRIGGKLHRDGHIYYNEEEIDSDKFLTHKIATYIEQEENHAPTLTVEETLEYAWRATSGGHHSYALAKDQESAEALDKFDEHVVRVKDVMTVLGLSGVKSTYVGDGAIRGVSGGQKRRVTLGEMAITPRKIHFMDCISNGLDSKTTFEILKCTRALNHVMMTTVVVALLQPPPEVYDLFDEVILLHEGQIIYQGPREDVMPYFNSLGYHCPDNMDIADFLQIIPTKEGRSYLQTPCMIDTANTIKIKDSKHEEKKEDDCKQITVIIEENTTDVKPDEEFTMGVFGGGRLSYHKANQAITFENHGTKSFVSAWKSSALFNDMIKRIGIVQNKIINSQENNVTQDWPEDMKEKYPQSLYKDFILSLKRLLKISYRDHAFIKARLIQNILIGSIAGALYNNIPTDNIQSTMGFLFFTCLFGALKTFATIPSIYKLKSVYKKHEDALMISPISFNMSVAATMFPLQITEAILFSVIVYWSAGMCGEGGRFLTFILINLFTVLAVAQTFQSVCFFFEKQTIAQPVCGLAIVFMVLLSGFILPPGQIPDWWIWYYYLNPLAYGFRANVIDQYTCSRYDFPFSSTDPTRYGNVVLKSYGFPTDYMWVWYSFALLVALWLVMILVSTWILKYMHFEMSPPPPIIITSEMEEEALQKSNDTRSKSAELPFDSCAFAFKNISYSVVTPDKEEIQLLSNVSGYFEPGTMTALMGTSGAGKTTLLDVLSGRKTTGTITGEMYINGKPKDQKHFKRIMAYVEQFDTLSPNETTRDAIEFSAALRLPSSVSESDRQKWVDAVIAMLELTPIENVIVGKITTGGMSFEQKKRLSIGVELASNPTILFLDEPTTGLDSRAAQIVMRSIRRVASSGRSIVCTIHQPSYPIFSGFDSLLLLRRGGQTVYFGQLGEKCKNLIDYFESEPNVPCIQENQNPATYMLEVLDVIDFHAYYKSSALCQTNTIHLKAVCPNETSNNSLLVSKEVEIDPNSMTLTSNESEYMTSYIHQFRWVMHKTSTSYWRTPSYNFVRFEIAILTAFIFSSAYPNQTYYEPADVIARYGLIYVTCLFLGVIGLQTVIPVSTDERVAYYREQQSTMYSPVIYSICTAIVEIPYVIVTSFLFVLPYFFFVGFQNVGNTAAKFGYYWLFIGLYEMVMISIGQMLVASTPTQQTTMVLAGILSTFFTMFAGFSINPADIPSFFQFVYWLDPLHYALQGLIFTQFKDDTTPVTLPSGQVKTAEQFTNDYFPTWSYDDTNYCILALFLFIIFNRWITSLALSYLKFGKR